MEKISMTNIQMKPRELFIGDSRKTDKNILSPRLDKTCSPVFVVTSDDRYEYLNKAQANWMGLYESGKHELNCNKLNIIKLIDESMECVSNRLRGGAENKINLR